MGGKSGTFRFAISGKSAGSSGLGKRFRTRASYLRRSRLAKNHRCTRLSKSLTQFRSQTVTIAATETEGLIRVGHGMRITSYWHIATMRGGKRVLSMHGAQMDQVTRITFLERKK